MSTPLELVARVVEHDHPGVDASPALARSIAIVCRNLVHEESPLLSMGRFELVRTLGRGGHGVVYEAIDPLRREPVALKVLHGRRPTDLYRLKREFRSLSELRHPNLVALHELSVNGSDALFTMDLIHGRDLLAYLRDAVSGGAVGQDHARDALAQLCEGVHALHRAGKLHRDIKPSNVLVTACGRVVLMDFGLVDDAHKTVAEVEGTPAYMAPEQLRGAPCEASDWYAVGRILSLALAGTPRTSELPQLALLAQRLLAPDPAARPRFAEILASVRDVPAETAVHALFGPVPLEFVGRRTELVQLEGALSRSRQRPAFLLVRGEAGIGKSALLREFAASVEGAAIVLHGRCYERESVPYKALDSAIDELSRMLIEFPPDHRARRTEAGRGALLALFPVLGRVPWLRSDDPPVEPRHPIELRARAVAELRSLFTALAAERPLVLCIDDLQWSDADSGALLGALLCDENSPRMLVVATGRSSAGTINPAPAPAPAIEEFQRVAEVSARPLCIDELELGPLAAEDSALLSLGLVAHDPRASEHLAADARGNPRVLTELARWIAEATNAQALERTSLEDVIDRRLRALDPQARLVLELVAAAGRPVSGSVVAKAAELSGLELRACVHVLRNTGLVRAVLRGEGELLELDHDRIGEVVLKQLDAAARAALHLNLVHALRAEQGDASEALIDHYAAAGMPLAAAHCARRAAVASLAAVAFERAARLYERALSLTAWSAAERETLHAELATSLDLAGRGVEAAAAYERAAEHACDPHAASQLMQMAADLLMRNGRYEEAEVLLQHGYRSLGLVWPEGRRQLALEVLREYLPVLKPLSRRSRGARTQSHDLRRTRVKFTAGAGRGIETYDILRAIHNSLLCCNEAKQLPDRNWHVRADGARALMRCFWFLPGGYALGIRQLEQACQEIGPLDDVEGRGHLENQLAVAYYFHGRIREALEVALGCQTFLRALPHTRVDLYAAQGIAASALFDLGRLREAARQWHALTHAARLQRDLMTTAWVHAQPTQFAVLFAYEDRARADAILEQTAKLRADNPRYPTLAWVHAASKIEHALYWGEPEAALEIVQREVRVLFAAHRNVLHFRVRMLRARACLRAAAARPAGQARKALLRQAAIDSAVLRCSGNPFNSGIALLVRAAIALLRQRPRAAIRQLEAAEAALDAIGARLLCATAQCCKGALLGGDAGRALERDALAAFEAEGVVDPRRYVAWLAAGFNDLLTRGR